MCLMKWNVKKDILDSFIASILGRSNENIKCNTFCACINYFACLLVVRGVAATHMRCSAPKNLILVLQQMVNIYFWRSGGLQTLVDPLVSLFGVLLISACLFHKAKLLLMMVLKPLAKPGHSKKEESAGGIWELYLVLCVSQRATGEL